MLRLYTYFRSSSAYRVRIALNHKDLEHELIPVHLVKDGGEQRKSDFLQKNPMGQIPVLEDDDFSLSQSLPIIQYIDSIKPETPLFSADLKSKLQQVELCEIINSGIQPIQNLKVLQYLKSDFNADHEKVTEWCRHWIENGFEALEKKLSQTSGQFSYKDELSAADCFLVPQVYNANRFKVDMSKFPNIRKIDELCSGLEAVKNAHPANQPDTQV